MNPCVRSEQFSAICAVQLVVRRYLFVGYLITGDWVYSYRAKRIVEMISQQTQPISLKDVQGIQGDDRNLNAQTLVPLLQSITVETPRLQAAQKLLRDWNLQLGMTSPAAALFEVFWKHLLADTFDDQLPQRYFPDGGDRWYAVVAKSFLVSLKKSSTQESSIVNEINSYCSNK